MTPYFADIIAREREALIGFFAYDINVPPLPREVTDRRYRHWKEHGFVLHYLPHVTTTSVTKTPKWKKAIAREPGFLEELFGSRNRGMNLLREREDLHLYSDALTLPGAWVVVDTRQKPPWRDDCQTFIDDGLIGATLSALRRQEKLPAHAHAQESRFGISWSELHDQDVRQAIAQVLEVDAAMVRLPHAIEWNLLSNLWYPHWGDTDTDEWYEDEYRNGGRPNGRMWKLYGGDSRNGGLTYVDCAPCDEHNDRRCFRPLITFPRSVANK
jgi:hypothetical protein